ncbi:MAG TPA: tyrosine-type recombinase/integrase [Streptosporangiaceae bacterium]|nr:tyrosine-type recombinase/integrase [Streptosporangiaceae bacterium]
MANKPGHRRFGSVRKLPSGRHQIRYLGPDGRIRTGPDTFERISDAQRALVLVEAQLATGDWTDPERGKAKLADYAATWIVQRPKLRPRTVDLYRWLLAKHITPYLGGVPLGKLSTAMIRDWRAVLLDAGVSVSVAAKAYRLLRAVLTTAVDEDKILPRNPCRIRGAGDEDAAERPVLTVAQVFELAEIIGRRPVGNVRQLADGSYRLRFGRDGEMRTLPQVFARRAEAEDALWLLANEGRADSVSDRRYLALVLMATFASLRWGEVSALRRCDIDLAAGTVRIRAAFVERSTGEILLGPPKSQASRRTVGIPQAIIPVLRQHLTTYAGPEQTALAFPGVKGGPLRRGNFNRMSGWTRAVQAIGAEGLHFHDLRHTGNTLAAASGARLRDLMARMGHDSERAALIYQHESRGADRAIADAIDRQLRSETGDDEDDGSGALVPVG